MKRLLAMILALLMLLTACVRPPEPTDPPQQTTGTEPTVPSEPERDPDAWDQYYEEDSIVEVLTKGAVKKYVPGMEHLYAVRVWNDGLLLFAGEKDTLLTYLGPEGLRYEATIPGIVLYPDGQTTFVTDTGICYYDGIKNAVVQLDTKLQEVSRNALAQQITGSLFLSEDSKIVYYTQSDALRWLDMETGISRILTQMHFGYQEVIGMHFDGSVLECFVENEGNSEVLYISTKTGQVLYSADEISFLHSSGDDFMARVSEGSVIRWIFGQRGGSYSSLLLNGEQISAVSLFDRNALLTHNADTTGLSLTYYDLQTGKRSAAARLVGVGNPFSVTQWGEGPVWFLAYGKTPDAPVELYCWDPDLSPVSDDTSYVEPYYTAETPDTSGLADIKKQAEALGNRYGIRIRVWEDAVKIQPSDYTFVPEYLVQAYQQALPVLEKALKKFPSGFFKRLGKQSNNQTLTVSLVRSAHGANELGSLDEADGVHFWNNGNSYIALKIGWNMEQTFYHELFHAMDTYILTETLAFDFWDTLNPSEFSYDYSYVTNQYREDYQYLEGESRWFIDMHSMSFPKEDRARIMEYAMMSGNGEFFQSDAMQAKLKTMCKGIREAFGLKKDTRDFPWEQYLNESLAYKK